MPSTIKVTLKGLLVIFIKRNMKECVVGFLRDVPADHEFKISIKKALAGGPFEPFREIDEDDIKDELALKVSNKEGISLRKGAAVIDRRKGSTAENKDSFLWVADFERDFHKKKVGAKKRGFRSILTLNNGELLTLALSQNQLLTKERPEDEPKNFGFVACETGIEIVLDQPNHRAVFKNGHEVIFEADSETSYEMTVDRGPLRSNHNRHRNDADHYYTALGHLIPGERRYFSSTDTPLKATPDAACFNGGGGTSWPT